MRTYRGELLRAELKPTLWQSLDNAVENGYGYEGDIDGEGHGVINGDPAMVAADSMDNDADVERFCNLHDFSVEEVAELVEEWQERKR